MIEELSATAAPQRVHPGAVYPLPRAKLCADGVPAATCAMPSCGNHRSTTTPQPRELNDLRIVRSVTTGRRRGLAYLGRVRVRSQVVGYRRIQHSTEAVVGEDVLDMPAFGIRDGRAVRWDLPSDLTATVAGRGLNFLGGIHAVELRDHRHPAGATACATGGTSAASRPRATTTRAAAQIALYDGFPGGVGIAGEGVRVAARPAGARPST